jgi:hypothetical protein
MAAPIVGENSIGIRLAWRDGHCCTVLSSGTLVEAASFTDWQAGYCCSFLGEIGSGVPQREGSGLARSLLTEVSLTYFKLVRS